MLAAYPHVEGYTSLTKLTHSRLLLSSDAMTAR